MTRFTAADAERAHDEWRCNCGPSALAAIMNLTLDEVRPLMGDFEAKGYTNPTLMYECMKRIGKPWSYTKGPWVSYGLIRIQWAGPWTGDGVPARVAYRHTHWIGCWTRGDGVGIFDINAINNGTGWCALPDWEREVVPFITQQIPRASGKWWPTHCIEIDRAAVFEGVTP